MRTTGGKLVYSVVCAAALFVLSLNGPDAGAQLESNVPKGSTFCNPLNLDYTYKITESDQDISYRSATRRVGFRGGYQHVCRPFATGIPKTDVTKFIIRHTVSTFSEKTRLLPTIHRDELLYRHGRSVWHR